MWCFVHFDLDMCFVPQRCALFEHCNFQKWSEPGVFVHFDFEMCFAPQRRGFSSSLIWPDGSAPAAFRPSGATNHWKNHSELRLFYLFAHLHLLSSDSFSSLIFFLLLFSSLTLPSAFPSVPAILSEVRLLNVIRKCINI